MADEIRIDVTAESAGGEKQIADALADAVERAMAGATKQIRREFEKVFERIGRSAFNDLARGADELTNGLRGTRQQAQFVADSMSSVSREARTASNSFEGIEVEIRSIADRLNAVRQTSEGVRTQLGEAFDPRNIASLESALEEIIRLERELANNDTLTNAQRTQTRQRIDLLRSEATAARETFLSQARAADEANRNVTRDLRQESRERIQLSRAATSRFVAEQQLQATATRASAQQRVAIVRGAARTIASIESGLSTVFRGTANIISSAFQGIRRTASNTSTSIRQSFQNSSQSTYRSVRNANQQISNSYQSSFRRNTSIVRNELNTQETNIRNFAREATEEISTIGLGALGGFALLGVAAGRALVGGFERATTIQDSERALTFLLGSAERAAELQAQVLDIVSGTPFKLDQFSQAATQLISFNVEAEKVPEYLRAIGDAAALRGGDTNEVIGRLITVFGQISALGRLQGDEILQLSEAGVPALQILGNTIGKTTEETQKLVSEGAIPAELALDSLAKGILEGTEGVNGATKAFGGLGKQLGGTLGGSVANLRIAFDRLGATIIQKFTPILTQAAQGATAFIDLIGVAFGALADAIVASPVFALIERAFDGLGDRIKSFGETIQPVLQRLATGLVTVGTALGGLRLLRALPGLLRAVTFAFTSFLTPTRLLITAGVLLAGFFQDIIAASPELREAFSNLGSAIVDALSPLVRLAEYAVPLLVDAFVAGLQPVVEATGDFIENRVIPALDAFAGFVRRTVVPAIQDFVFIMYAQVIPAVQRFLVNAIDIAKEGFASLVDFVKGTVIPTVGPILARAVEIGKAAFEDVYGFLSGTLVPFIQNNLAATLTTLGTTVAGFAIGGPLGALLGLGGGIGLSAAVFSDFRGKIVDLFTGIVEDVQGALSDLFDDGFLREVGFGALRVIRRVGEIVGSIATDPKFLGAIAAIGAAGVAAATAFVIGFGDALLDNLAEFTDILVNFLSDAVKAAVSDPRIIAAFATFLVGGTLLSRLRSSAQQSGRIIGASLAEGVGEAALATPGQAGFGRGAGSFVSALFGGRGRVDTQVRNEMRTIRRTVQSEVNRTQRAIRAISGEPLRIIEPGRGGVTAAQALQTTRGELGRLTASLGPARAGALLFRDAFSRSFSGNIRDRISQVGTAISTLGITARGAAIAAGATLGGAFAASFVSQAIFDSDATGADKLAAGLGTLAVSIGTGAAIGGGAGAVAGAAVGGFGLLTGAIRATGEAAREAAADFKDYSNALSEARFAGEDSDLFSLVLGNVREQSDEVRDALLAVRFDYDGFVKLLSENNPVETTEFLRSYIIQLGRLPEEYKGAADAQQFLSDEWLNSVGAGAEAARIAEENRLAARDLNEEVKALSVLDLSPVAAEYQAAKVGAEVAEQATEAFRTRVEELNEERLDVVRQQVDEVKNVLSEAERKADDAKQAVVDFLTGGNDLDLEQATDRAIGNIGRAGEAINTQLGGAAEAFGIDMGTAFNQIVDDSSVAGAELRENVRIAGQEAANLLAQALEENGSLTPEQGAAAIQPLLDAAPEKGTAAGDAIRGAIQEELDKLESEEFQLLSSDAATAEGERIAAEVNAAIAEQGLKFQLDQDPFDIETITEQAASTFEEVGAAAIEGIAAGLDENSSVSEQAAATAAENALEAAAAALGISSPSTAFIAVGRDSALGLSVGLIGGVGQVRSASVILARSALAGVQSAGLTSQMVSAGRNAAAGLSAGLAIGAGSVYNTARNIANNIAAIIRAALQVASPSKVTAEIGEEVANGLGVGITAASYATIKTARTFGEAVGVAIGQGIADEGPNVLGQVGSILDNVGNVRLSAANLRRETTSRVASQLFARQLDRGTTSQLDLQSALSGAGNALQGFREAIAGIRDQVSSARKAVREGGASLAERALASGSTLSLSLNTVAGRANREAFFAAGTQIREFGQTMLDAGYSVNTVISQLAQYRERLKQTGIQLGFNRKTLQAFLDQLGLTNADLAQFRNQVNEVTAASARQQAEAEARAEQLRQQQSLLPPITIVTPASDPEAVALSVLNRVAFAAR